MIKFAILAVLIVAVTANPRPQDDDEPKVLKRWDNNNLDQIDYGYEMSDGTKQIQKGYVENYNTPEAKTIITYGLFAYPLADNRLFQTEYSTDPATGSVNQKSEFKDL